MQIFCNDPWKEMESSRGSRGILFAHSAKNLGLYKGLSWTPIFYAEQYNIGVRDSAVLSLLPSLAGVVGGFIAGFAVDSILRKIQTDNDGMIDDEIKTKIRKVFQGISLNGGAIALGTLALNMPDEAWVAQTYLTTAVGFLGFD
jgi:MFS transporter, ACS family, solute carrier family 17 (sodium-dependent inorganic phosphate cotransporter), other